MILTGSTVPGRGQGSVLAGHAPTSARPEGPSRSQAASCPFCETRLSCSTAAHDRVLLQDRLIQVLPDLAPLSPGHLLVASRRHVLSMAQLGAQSLAEIEITLKSLCTELRYAFGEYFLFEHGTSPDASGPCIDHAHIHMLPLATTMSDRLTSALPWRTLLRYESLSLYDDCGYVYLNICNRNYVSSGAFIGSQWIRQQVAIALRRDDWDWCLTRSAGELKKTLEVFERLPLHSFSRDSIMEQGANIHSIYQQSISENE